MVDVYSSMVSSAQRANAPAAEATYKAASIVEAKLAELQDDVKRLESIKTEIETLRKEFKGTQPAKWYQNTVLWSTVIAAVTGVVAIVMFPPPW